MILKEISILLLSSLLIGLIIGKFGVSLLSKLSVRQHVSEWGPKSHLKKQGVPTMGGLIFIVTLLISLAIFHIWSGPVFIVLVSSLIFAAIGFIDDFRMLVLNRAVGLTPKQKLLLQVLAGIAMTLVIKNIFPDSFGQLRVPFTGSSLNIGAFSYILYPLVFVATTNATNLTDGLDGLLTSVSLPVFVFLFLITARMGMGALSNFIILLIGGLLAFLAYNSNKASVFMGDVGSLFIGGLVASIAIVTGLVIFLLIFGIVYIMETGSVIIQVASYKLRDKKRVFLMTPIHHHYELKGYSEQKIVTNFSLVSLIACLLCIIIY